MKPEYVRFGDRYVIPVNLIKYFYMDTAENKLIAKLTDGELINLTYQGDDRYVNCLRNYKYLLDIFGVEYPHWLNEKELRKLNSNNIDDDEED